MNSTDQRKTDDIQISILTRNLELKTKQTKPKAFLMVKNKINITTHLTPFVKKLFLCVSPDQSQKDLG